MPGNKAREAFVLYEFVPDAGRKSHSEISQMGKDLLAWGIRKYYGADPESFALKEGEHGKPYFEGYPFHIHFNISNSGNYIVLILARIPVGIDIQEKRITDIDKLGKKVFSVDEYRKFLASDDRQEEFFRQWVLKESYVKWTGEGLLRRDLKELPMDGWSQFVLIDMNYFCAVRAKLPLDLRVEEVRVYE